MKYEEQVLDLSSISDQDCTFQITTEPCTDALIRCINSVGLLHPPVVINTNSSFVVISGFRRVAACRLLNHSQIHVKILPQNTSFLECAKLAIADNSCQRALNLMELSASYALLLRGAGDLSLASQTASCLGLPDNRGVLQKILKLQNLPKPIQAMVASGSVTLAAAIDLLQFSENDQLLFADMFNTLQLSLNKQKELMTLTQEIAIRERISVTDVLSNHRIAEIFNSHDLDRGQKAALIRLLLKEWRFPNLTQAKDAFQSMIKSLHLEKGFRLNAPPDFEGTDYSIHLTFRNPKELQYLRTKFDELIQHPDFLKFFQS